MSKGSPERAAAVITIRRAGSMSKKERAAIAAWLRNHARWVVQHGAEYADGFRGRYIGRTK